LNLSLLEGSDRRSDQFALFRPSILLLVSTLTIVVIACLIPFTVIGGVFGFVQPPFSFFAVLAGLVTGYLILVELTKKWFYRKYSLFIERERVPSSR